MAIILGKPIVGRKETLEYANKRFDWPSDVIIGISAWYGFWSWIRARLTGRKCIYYCIDFYSPEIAKNLWDKIFIWAAMQMDKFLINHVDEVWDISNFINSGRRLFGNYMAAGRKIVPLSYPPSYFKLVPGVQDKIAYVGLEPYGLELLKKVYSNYVWFGKEVLLPIERLLDLLSCCGIGISIWKEKGNNYYGDPGKTKLYSACGLPVIMTDNTPYADIIKKTKAGLVIDYSKEALTKAIDEIQKNYAYYKGNVPKTWEYINADKVFRGLNEI